MNVKECLKISLNVTQPSEDFFFLNCLLIFLFCKNHSVIPEERRKKVSDVFIPSILFVFYILYSCWAADMVLCAIIFFLRAGEKDSISSLETELIHEVMNICSRAIGF